MFNHFYITFSAHDYELNFESACAKPVVLRYLVDCRRIGKKFTSKTFLKYGLAVTDIKLG